MRVRATCTLKNSSVGIISVGTIFEGTMETLPGFVVGELERNRGTFEILSDIKAKKQIKQRVRRKPKPKSPVESETETPPKGKSVSLREKLTNSEK